MKLKPTEAIYLIHPYEYRVINIPIYKIGKTIRKVDNRLAEYENGCIVYLARHVNNADTLERKILDIFNKEFKLLRGREYFTGNILNMIKIINDIVDEELLYHIQNNNISLNEIISINLTDDNKKIIMILK